MSEKRFLSFILTEGIISIILGSCLLVLPKITDITFGFLLAFILTVYGGYKAIKSFLSRNFESHFLLNIIAGILLLFSGIGLFFAPFFEMIVIVSAIGLYFILESISSGAFASQVMNIFYFWRAEIFVSSIQLLFGLILIVLFPSLWMAGVLVGTNSILAGAVLLNMYYSKKYIK